MPGKLKAPGLYCILRLVSGPSVYFHKTAGQLDSVSVFDVEPSATMGESL